MKSVQSCTCEEVAECLLQLNILVLHSVLNGLLLECKVLIKGFCEDLKARQPYLYKESVAQEGKQM